MKAIVILTSLLVSACTVPIPMGSQYPAYHDPYYSGSDPIATYCWNPDPVKAAFCRGQVDAQREARRKQIRDAYEKGRGTYRGYGY